MDSSIVMDIAIESLVVTIKVALPVLAGALSAGVIVGVLQAATSIQEMTLSFIPKLAVMAFMLALFGEWQLNVLMEFFDAIFERVRNLEA